MSDQIYEKLVACNGNDFFNTLEEILKTSIPPLLKNITKISGFDNPLALTKFEDSSFTEIEDFMRFEFDIKTVPCSDNVENYLDIYKNRQEKFKLVCQSAYKDQPMLRPANAKFVNQEVSKLSTQLISFIGR